MKAICAVIKAQGLFVLGILLFVLTAGIVLNKRWAWLDAPASQHTLAAALSKYGEPQFKACLLHFKSRQGLILNQAVRSCTRRYAPVPQPQFAAVDAAQMAALARNHS